MKIARHRAFRIVGWVVAYVLALQTILFGLAGISSHHAIAGAGLDIKLCLTSDIAGGGGDGIPSEAPRDHCQACFAAGSALPPPGASPQPVVYALAVAPNSDLRALPPHAAGCSWPGLPRAPPSLA